MAKKIVVIQLKEIIYTVIFAALGILLILLLIFMFNGKEEEAVPTTQLYKAGVWTSSIALKDTAINLEVILDENQVKSVKIVNIDETVTTMFPLVEPSLAEIVEQLYDGVPINEVELSDTSRYTQTLLLEAIKAAIDKATVTP